MTAGAPVEPVPGSLGRAAASGFAWSFGSAVVQLGLQIVSFSILSRLLTPVQYGVVAAANLVVGFLTMLGQLGVGPALVQRARLRSVDVVSAFYFSLALSSALAVIVAAGASVLGPVAGLTKDTLLLQALALVLPIQGMAVVSRAMAQRDLRFKGLAVADIASYGVAYLAVGVFFAERGAGPWALVWAQIAAASLDATLYYALVRHRVRPADPAVMWESVRSALAFGGGVSLGGVGNWFARNADSFVVVHALGLGSLAVYNRAYQLLAQSANMIGGIADTVLFPMLSRIQSDRERLIRAYVRVSACIAFMVVPLSVLLYILAPEIVRILFGSKWSGVTAPFRVFALVLLPRTAYRISDSLTRATGAVFGDAWRQWLYGGEVLTGAGIGQMWGTTGVAVGASVAMVAHFLALLLFSARIGRKLITGVASVYAKYLVVAAAMTLVCFPIAHLIRAHDLGSVTVVAATVTAGVIVALSLPFLLRRHFEEELRLAFAVLRGIRRSRLPLVGRMQPRVP